MAQGTKQTQAPVLCASGCGFYGNSQTNGMCSVCYKDSLQTQNNTARINTSESSDGCSVAVESSAVVVSSAQSVAASAAEQSSTEDITLQRDGAGLQTEPSEVSHSTAESRVASEQEQCTVGQPEVAGSSGAGQEGRGLVSELSCRRGKRKLEEETDPLGEEAGGSSLDSSDLAPECSPDQLKQKKSRCFTCRKKVGLTGFDCRCGNVFCCTHRYSDVHNCSFDYKAEAAEKIRKENPVVVGEKIHKI